MFYALRHKEDHSKWVGISIQAQDGEFCNSVTAEFEFNDSIPFITSDISILEDVKRHIKRDEWYNSSVDNPELCDYDIKQKAANDYEIVELGVI